MGLLLTVKGANIDIQLSEFEIDGFEFAYNAPDSKYAKSGDERCLRITGRISAMIENNPTALASIREWANIGRIDADCYTFVKVAAIHREEEVRAITFPEAFVKAYEEKIDPHTGQGQLVLSLMQKADKRTDIVIDPFNQAVTSQ